MLDSGFKIDFSFITLIWRVIKRFWYMLLGGMILGIIVSVIAYYCVTPLYKSQLRFFTWNQTVSDAAREIGKSIDKEGSKAQSVIMYNNLVSQSMVIGQSLVEDYKLLLANSKKFKLNTQWLYILGFFFLVGGVIPFFGIRMERNDAARTEMKACLKENNYAGARAAIKMHSGNVDEMLDDISVHEINYWLSNGSKHPIKDNLYF